MRKKENPLTDQQKKAVAMYHDSYRFSEIAAELGVHRTTIWRWSKLRGFWREYNRIKYNKQRRIMRRQIKEEREAEAYWSQRLKEAEQKLNEKSRKIKTRPGKTWYKAWNEYQIAACRGRSAAEVLRAWEKRNRRRHKRKTVTVIVQQNDKK